MPDTIRHGWWSAQAAREHGYSIYETPDGVRINVTHVTSDPTSHGTMWPDIRYKGPVTKHCKNIQAPDGCVDDDDYMPMALVPHDEMTFKVIKNRTPPNPCPLSYTGTGNCTCGKCVVRTRHINRNPFGY